MSEEGRPFLRHLQPRKRWRGEAPRPPRWVWGAWWEIGARRGEGGRAFRGLLAGSLTHGNDRLPAAGRGGENGGGKAQSSNRKSGSGEVRECGSATRTGLRANGRYEHTFGVRERLQLSGGATRGASRPRLLTRRLSAFKAGNMLNRERVEHGTRRREISARPPIPRGASSSFPGAGEDAAPLATAIRPQPGGKAHACHGNRRGDVDSRREAVAANSEEREVGWGGFVRGDCGGCGSRQITGMSVSFARAGQVSAWPVGS